MNTVKRMSVLLAVLALIPLAWGQIATNEPSLRLTVDLVDGSRLVGVPGTASIPVQTAYAKLDIALKQVQSIKMEKDREMAVFEMRNGDRVKGAMTLKKLDLQTTVGKVSVGLEHINKVVIAVYGLSGKATATGGIITNYTLGGTDYTAHIFTNSGTFTVSGGTLNCDALVVAGGGGGSSGGGGAGGLIYTSSFEITEGSVSVVVGAGGAGTAWLTATPGNGSNSSFGVLEAIGGGGGQRGNIVAGINGGSGGGAGAGQTTNKGGFGISGQGHDGGDCLHLNWDFPCPSGGGGGAGEAGHDTIDVSTSGDGGDGLAYDISGVSTYYAGGGGGDGANFGGGTPGSGGLGGGGAGNYSGGVSGTANTGGGGGSHGGGSSVGGKGGSGIVIVRYPHRQPSESATLIPR